MSLKKMPNGEYVDVPDDITPEGLQRIQQQNTPTRQQRIAAGQPRSVNNGQSEVQKYARQLDKVGGQSDTMRAVGRGLTFGLADEIGGGLAAATSGVFNAVRKGDIGEVGKAYRFTRDVERERDRIAADRSPIASGVGEMLGAVVNPLGAGDAVLATGGRVAAKAGMSRAASALGNASARVARSGPIVQGVLAGANQGALNAAGNADELSDVPGAVTQGTVLGGAAGGLIGGAAHLGARGVQILNDRSAKNAERTAYGRIAEMLGSGKTDARKVAREIAVTDARGGDAMVQDVLPSLRAQAGAISRKPSVSGSNELIERGDQRIQDRRARFGQQVRDTVDMPVGGTDALARGDALAGARKVGGQGDYAEGGIMDTPINPTPALQAYLKEAPEEVQGAMRGAYREMLLRDQKPGDFVGDDGIFTHIPNLRTFDYVKRGFNQQIGTALRSGDKATAQGLSYQLDKLKGVLADANPNSAEYGMILKSQRDAFQQQNALEIGQNVLGRMTREPRLVLRELKGLPEHAVQDARVGIIDALVNADTKADPVAYFRTMMRNETQKKVMEFAFGGKGNLGRFERWVNREVRGTRADVLTAPGRQSETARFAMAADDTQENVGNVLSNAMRGFAFGGTIGAASGVVRTMQNLASGTSRMTQEEIAKILLSKGQNLVKGTEEAAAYKVARSVGNRRRARMFAKAGQQIYTDEAGGN